MTRSVLINKPKGWNETPAYADQLVHGIFFAFKTPLKQTEWDVGTVFNHAAQRKWDIGLWIDLTFTTRYYQPQDVLRRNAEYKKFLIEGQQAPNNKQISEFIQCVTEYRVRCPDRVIGIHCTHGLNRTGFMICAYLCKELELSVIQAFENFQTSRPPGMYRQNMVNDLVEKYACKVSSIPVPKVSLPPWKGGGGGAKGPGQKPNPVINGARVKRSSPDGSGSKRKKASRWSKPDEPDRNINWRLHPSDRLNSTHRDSSTVASNSQHSNAHNTKVPHVGLKDFYRRMPLVEGDDGQSVLEELRTLLSVDERTNPPGGYKELTEETLQHLSESYLVSYLPPQGHSLVLFLDSRGKAHFVDPKSRVRSFGDAAEVSDDKDKLFSTVMEGFLTRVSDRREGQRICYEISDVLIHNGQSLAEEILTKRLKLARDILSKQLEELFKNTLDGKNLYFEEMQSWDVTNAIRMLQYDPKRLYPSTPYGFFFSPLKGISDTKLIWVDAKLLRVFIDVKLTNTENELNDSVRVEFHTNDDDSKVLNIGSSNVKTVMEKLQSSPTDDRDGMIVECKYCAITQSFEYIRPSATNLRSSDCSHFVDRLTSGAINQCIDSTKIFRLLMSPKSAGVMKILEETKVDEPNSQELQLEISDTTVTATPCPTLS